MRTRLVIALIVILCFGAAKLRFENDLAIEHRKAYFHGAKLNLALREQVGQFGFVAALSGFRSLVADMLWIRAHTAWEKTEWGRMALIFNQVVALQPRALLFWDMAGWHMAWNASVSALNNPKQPNEVLRRRAAHEYILMGEDFLLRGIKNNPDRHLLFERLGMLYRDKLQDPCRASEYYDKGKDLPGAPSYVKRFAAYELARCPGREREAYERLKYLYNLGEQERLPTLLKLLGELQQKLGIPEAEKIAIPADSKL